MTRVLIAALLIVAAGVHSADAGWHRNRRMNCCAPACCQPVCMTACPQPICATACCPTVYQQPVVVQTACCQPVYQQPICQPACYQTAYAQPCCRPRLFQSCCLTSLFRPCYQAPLYQPCCQTASVPFYGQPAMWQAYRQPRDLQASISLSQRLAEERLAAIRAAKVSPRTSRTKVTESSPNDLASSRLTGVRMTLAGN